MHQVQGPVVITGAHGYLGRHVVTQLARQHPLVALVSPRSREQVGQNTTWHLDLAGGWDEDMRTALLAGGVAPRAIVHLAGLTSVAESYEREQAYMTVNAEGTARLVREARKLGVEHFILASTLAVYASTNHQPLEESSATEETSPYARSKLAAEQACKDERGSMRLTILRLTNLAGRAKELAGISHPGVAPELSRRAVRGQDITLTYGYETDDGTVMRDFLHVADAARAVESCLERKGPEEVTLNIASGLGTTLEQLITTIIDEASSPSKVLRGSYVKSAEPAVRVASIARARDLLGWQPEHSLRRIVRDEVSDARAEEKQASVQGQE